MHLFEFSDLYGGDIEDATAECVFVWVCACLRVWLVLVVAPDGVIYSVRPVQLF